MLKNHLRNSVHWKMFSCFFFSPISGRLGNWYRIFTRYTYGLLNQNNNIYSPFGSFQTRLEPIQICSFLCSRSSNGRFRSNSAIILNYFFSSNYDAKLVPIARLHAWHRPFVNLFYSIIVYFPYHVSWYIMYLVLQDDLDGDLGHILVALVSY